MLRNTLIFLSESNAAKAVVTKTPLRYMSRRFVPGEGVGDFLRASEEANALELMVTGNYLGEAELHPGLLRGYQVSGMDGVKGPAHDADVHVIPILARSHRT